MLHSIFAFGEKRGWCAHNPCKKVDKPRAGGRGDAEIRFLDEAELEALLRAVPDDHVGPLARVLGRQDLAPARARPIDALR